jgi:Ca2+-binding EF-hand superfamily protein
MGNFKGGLIREDISDADFNVIFDMFDTDKSGTIEKEEMVNFIKHFMAGGDNEK